MRWHGLLGLMIGCALVAPAAAAASSAGVKSSETCPSEFECNGFPTSAAAVLYDAAAGEANAVVLSFADPVVAVRDLGAAVSVRAGCTSVSEHEAACAPDRAGGTPGVAVQLGDLDDTLAVAPGFPYVTGAGGGPGNDALTGGAETDNFDGGPGDDRLAGSDGADSLKGGEGADSVAGGGGDDIFDPLEEVDAADVYDGGEGRDQVSFLVGTRAVSVALGGAPGQLDSFTGVEGVTGGSGNDRLTGDGGANALSAVGGADRLDGGAGPDYLDGGPGRDEIRGGSGDDTIAKVAIGPGARGGDRVFCGPGVDTVADSHRLDVLARDCERVGLGTATMRPYPVVRRGVARFVVPCRSRRGCRGRVRVGARERSFKTRRRGRIRVAVPLPRRGKLVRVRVSLVRRGDGASGQAAYTVRIPR